VDRLTGERLREGTAALAARDPDLAALVRRHGAPPLWSRRPGFPTLLRIILEQQVSLRSAEATYRRLERGIGPLTAERVASAGPARVRARGVTRQKASYGVEAARAIASGRFDLHALGRLPDAAARDRLMTLRGVGPWTADIYLLMALRRPDVWPVGDLALQASLRRIGRLREGGDPRAGMERVGAAWRPWRAVAARLLWMEYLAERAAARRDRVRKEAP